MNPSRIFIERPVATTLLTLGVTLAGTLGFLLLPVAPLPQVDFPTISVRASLPGASPETMAATVATPLERALSQIASVTEMTSSSTFESTRITLQFELDRNIDGAARDVQAALQAARNLLPSGLRSNPTYRKVNPADAPFLILSLTSDVLTRGQLYDAASTILAQKLSQISGVGDVLIGGSSLPAVRVELDPGVLDQYGIGLEDVRNAIVATNVDRPKGAVEAGATRWQILANDQAKTAADYLPLIVSFRSGAAVRLADVARVTDSVEDLRNYGSANGRPAVLLVLTRQPGANVLATVARVKALLPQLRSSIPAGMSLDVAMDSTPTIRASLREVNRALVISVALVVVAVLLFLRDLRAAMIPLVAVPVSLIGTYGVIYLAGFSLDNLSLMALAIAAGFVVDDAVVVLENISRHVDAGTPKREAAIAGAREVGFTVLSMSLSLVAAFIPILLMSGVIGRLFREFAITLTAAIAVSLVVSLTTTPMMCSRLLEPRGARRRPGRLYRASERAFAAIQAGYRSSLDWALAHGPIMLLILSATVALNVFLYVVVPKGFFPQQDTGKLMGALQVDHNLSFQATREKLAHFADVVKRDPAVDTVVAVLGGGQANSGLVYASLEPREKRGTSADAVIARLRGQLSEEPGASVFLQSVQDIRVGGRSAKAQYQYTLQADDLDELRRWEPRLRRAMSALPQLADVNTDAQDRDQETMLSVDRDEVARLGLDEKSVDSTLSDLFSQRQVSTIYHPLNQYRVVMEAAPEFSQSPEALKQVHVTGPNGAKVPLAAIARYGPSPTRPSVNHQGQLAASTISFNLAQGASLSDATRAIETEFARLGAPPTLHASFQGTARAFRESMQNQPLLILAALIAVYLVLGILYESLVHPLTILSTLPSAGVGALLTLIALKKEFSVIALIGVILLIGIVKKNAIMMIDFALQLQREHALSARDAVYEACLLRLRPILMTTVAALFGALPLALGMGEGAELRQPLGLAVAGGLVLSQLLTLYTTPVVYLYLDRFGSWARTLASGSRPPLARAADGWAP